MDVPGGWATSAAMSITEECLVQPSGPGFSNTEPGDRRDGFRCLRPAFKRWENRERPVCPRILLSAGTTTIPQTRMARMARTALMSSMFLAAQEWAYILAGQTRGGRSIPRKVVSGRPTL